MMNQGITDIPTLTQAGIYDRAGIYTDGGFDIGSLNPYLYMDAGTSMLATGGGQAGFLDSVATLDNLSTGDNAASNAVQATASRQGKALPLISGGGYLYIPDIAGNTATVPLASSGGDTIVITTVPAGAASEVTATAGSGSVTIGPASGAFQIQRLVVSVNGSDELVIDFTNVTDLHNATSITATTGQTVTINQSGNDPATLVRIPLVRLDGVDDFYAGTFASSMVSGRFFAVFKVHSGETTATVMRTGVSSSHFFSSTNTMDWIQRNGSGTNTRVYYSGGTRMSGVGEWSGLKIHESLISGGTTNKYLIDGVEEDTSAVVSTGSGINFAIGGAGVSQNSAIDLHALVHAPSDITEEQATEIRAALNSKFSIY